MYILQLAVITFFTNITCKRTNSQATFKEVIVSTLANHFFDKVEWMVKWGHNELNKPNKGRIRLFKGGKKEKRKMQIEISI